MKWSTLRFHVSLNYPHTTVMLRKWYAQKTLNVGPFRDWVGRGGINGGNFFFYFEIELILSVTLSLTSPTRKYLFNTTIQTLKQRLWMLILGLSFKSLLLTLDWYLHKGLYKKIFCSQILCIKLISKNLQQNPWESFFSQIVYLKACNFTKNDPIKGSSFEFANFP